MKPKGIVIKSIIAILMLLCACSNGKTDTEEMSLPTFGTQNAINQEEGCDLEMFAPQIDKAISLNGTEGFQQTDIINVEPYYTTSGNNIQAQIRHLDSVGELVNAFSMAKIIIY